MNSTIADTSVPKRQSAEKKRVLFFGLGGSHILPQLDIARSLLRNGHEVFFVTLVAAARGQPISLQDEFSGLFHVRDLSEAFRWEGREDAFNELLADLSTKAVFSLLDEPYQSIPMPGDLLWQCALDQRWNWFEDVVREADPCAIVFDTVLDGYGKYMALEFGIPAYGTCPLPLTGGGFDNQEFANFWAEKAPPGAFRTSAVDRLAKKLRAKGMITGDGGDHDLHGADLTHSDYTFCFSSELMEGQVYKEICRSGKSRSKVLFIGRDYSVELESGLLAAEDREFLAEITAGRAGAGGTLKKLVFISLGTQARQPSYFNDYVMDALGDLEDVIVVLQLCSGTKLADEEFAKWKSRAPKNFVVYAALKTHTVMMHVLREAELFVSHVGRNTLMEGISQGVPIVALPVSGDQYDNAQVVVNEGLGRAFGIGDSPQDQVWKNIVSNGKWHGEPAAADKSNFVHALKDTVLSMLADVNLQVAVRDKKNLAAGLGFDVARDIILGVADPNKYTPSLSSSSAWNGSGPNRTISEMKVHQ